MDLQNFRTSDISFLKKQPPTLQLFPHTVCEYLSIRHVQVKAQVMVQGCGNAWSTGAKMQHVAMVTGSAASCIVLSTR